MNNYGLNDHLKYNEFVFDSVLATRSKDNSFSPKDWPNYYPGKPLTNVAAIKIIEAQIPFSFYVFTPTNNVFYLLESPTSFSTPLTVTITPGNYTVDAFIANLGIWLTTASSQAGGSNVTYSAAFSFATSKISISTTNATSGFSFKIYMRDQSVPYQPTNLQPGPWMGFYDGQVYTSTTTLFGNNVTDGGTMTLLNTSPKYQLFTGTNTQTVSLPLLSSVSPGEIWTIYSSTTEDIVVEDSTGTDLAVIVPSTYVEFKVSGAGTAWIVGDVQVFSEFLPLGAQATLEAPNVMALSGPNYIYICSRALGPLVKLFLPGDRIKNDQQLGADGPHIAMIAVNVNSGNLLNWQDPDPQKWFDLDNLANLPSIDLYCTAGKGDESIPLTFNGLGFSVKMGILTYDPNVTSNLGGGSQNNRVQLKQFQPGNLY